MRQTEETPDETYSLPHSAYSCSRPAQFRGAAQVNPYKDGTPGVTGYRSEVLAEVTIQADKVHAPRRGHPRREVYPGVLHPTCALSPKSSSTSAWPTTTCTKLVGTPPPTDLDLKGLEKSTTDKAKVIATLKDSFAHAKKRSPPCPTPTSTRAWTGSAERIPSAAFCSSSSATPPSTFGQSIAYARVVGIVPPWTEDMQKKQPEKKEAPAKDKQ